MRHAAVSSLMFSVLASACGPTPEQVQAAIAQTQAAIPTATTEPTATPDPFTAVELEALLLQSGDLPPNYELSQYVSDFDVRHWGDPVLFRGVGIQVEGFSGKGARVGVYDTIADAEAAYFALSGKVGDAVDGLGKEAHMRHGDLGLFAANDIDVTWYGCLYAVQLNLFGPVGDDTAITYARRLDERLSGALCQ